MPVLISKNANIRLINEFPEVILVDKTAPVYDAVSCHPDIYHCLLPDGSLVSAWEGEIGAAYPENIGFNAVCLDKYFIHNLKYTNHRLLNCVRELGLTTVNVKQGYTKCSCVVVNGNSIITADDGIYNTLSAIPDINILKIRPGYINLQGCEYGFIGGASGKVGDMLYFSGDLSKHPDFDAMCRFIESKNVKYKYFDYPLEDIGSIIEFKNQYKKSTEL